MHVKIDAGTLDTKADSDKDTLQVILVKGLAPQQGKVSADGQVIYTSTDATSDQALLTKLLNEALVRRIAVDTSLQCPGLAGL